MKIISPSLIAKHKTLIPSFTLSTQTTFFLNQGLRDILEDGDGLLFAEKGEYFFAKRTKIEDAFKLSQHETRCNAVFTSAALADYLRIKYPTKTKKLRFSIFEIDKFSKGEWAEIKVSAGESRRFMKPKTKA